MLKAGPLFRGGSRISSPNVTPRRRWSSAIGVVVGVVGLVIVTAVVGVGAEPSGAEPTATQGTQGAGSTSPFAGLVSISPSRKMFLECRGSGSPTVVLIAGGLNSAAIWSMPYDFAHPGPTVFPEVSKFTRVCAYDRPGTASPAPNDQIAAGTSTPVPQP